MPQLSQLRGEEAEEFVIWWLHCCLRFPPMALIPGRCGQPCMQPTYSCNSERPQAGRSFVRKQRIPRTVDRALAASAVLTNKLLLHRIEWNLPRAVLPTILRPEIDFYSLPADMCFQQYRLCQDCMTWGSSIPESSSGSVFLLTPSHFWYIFHTQAVLQSHESTFCAFLNQVMWDLSRDFGRGETSWSFGNTTGPAVREYRFSSSFLCDLAITWPHRNHFEPSRPYPTAL